MIKLSELVVTPQNITPEKVLDYFWDNILLNNIEFKSDSDGLKEYKEMCKPYCEKYNISGYFMHDYEFKKLSQSELNKFYKDMRALVRKHVGKEILSELQITPQGITPEKVQKYFDNNILYNDIEFGGNSDGWKEYKEICKPYCGDFEKLSQPNLNQLYQKMRALVRKYVGKEILSELQVKISNITANEVYMFFQRNILFKTNLPPEKWIKYKEICKPYCEKYGIGYDVDPNDPRLTFNIEFEKLSPSELNKLYIQLKKLVNEKNLSELQITPQNITPEKVYDYFHENITSEMWIDYKKLCEPYCEKYDTTAFLYYFDEFEKLSQSDLKKFYYGMQTIVHKHKK